VEWASGQSTVHALRAALGASYTIERELGRGGMATVYLARDLRHRRSVAVKVMYPCFEGQGAGDVSNPGRGHRVSAEGVRRRIQSVGILVYRGPPNDLEVFLVHPGSRSGRARMRPRGSYRRAKFDVHEDPLAATKRELEEETGVSATADLLPRVCVTCRTKLRERSPTNSPARHLTPLADGGTPAAA